MKTTLITLILILVSFLWGNAQTYTLEDRWVDCGNNTQLLDPYYSPGVTFTWTGSSKGGKANGQGVATKYVNGKFESKYEGTYRNGIREGKGTFTHMDGSVKTGTFVNGQLTGKGTVKDENGNSYEGDFINYRMHGNGTLRWGNGSTFVGNMVNDVPYTGKYTSYTGEISYIQRGEPVEQLSESKSRYSPKIGQQVREYFDENWNRCDPKHAAYFRLITYSAPNKPQGVVKDYYITGELQSEQLPVFIDYDDEGKTFLEGKQTFYHKNGKVASVRYYYNNQPNGPQTDYYPDGLLDDIDFDKYRIVKEEERAIVLENEDTNVKPIPVGTGGGKPQPEMDALSSIVKDFNDTYGNIEWKNRDEVQRQIEELPARIATSVDFVNAVRNGDKQVAQITFNDDIINIVAAMLEEKTEFVQTYFANPDFQNFVNARVFQAAVSQLSSQRV